MNKWLISTVRYILYMLYIKMIHGICVLGYRILHSSGFDHYNYILRRKTYAGLFVACIAVLKYFDEKFIEEEVVWLFIGYLVTLYLEMKENSSVTYGVGMACSFFEGYLAHIIPSDGANFVGFEENINIYEASQGVVFPVKKLFIIITKSLYCPPDLKHFNKKNQRLPYLEACRSLFEVEKDVAGVKGRTYRNSAYKIHRQNEPPVYLAAECATPLHTLHKALERRTLSEMLGNVDVEQVVSEFCSTLQQIIARSPDCRDKCQLVYFNDINPNENLADILLDEINRIEALHNKTD
ncbi:stimulator of interferon genes protein-like isoform X2 [Leptidea sinapis]|nr:stimulator of interferon genes protein-like isoform X2 [Leptidea sinapis]XP_050664810.1 stimulator of interferon genes protein-like isoform X2 [Leptidea sinapis]XP_050664811.1 stimulator of interferon genes protein-like isoform X2 [Leptidea sinapis]